MDKSFSCSIENITAKERWDSIHSSYALADIVCDDWLEQFGDIINDCNTPIIDLGCGSGNNIKYLLERGKAVVACDFSPNAITNAVNNFPQLRGAMCFDLTEPLPFEDNFTALIIADLSLHYFPMNITQKVLEEIMRVLTPGGIVLLRVNSVKDVNHGAGQGEEIERHLYKSEDGRLKRFFDRDDINSIFAKWNILYAEENEMRRYVLPKMLWTIALKPNK
ncbi:MAG: class I SAM-dependent methyltransferase [Oscillospiraceae bacterium]|nr:class I SAM-dependent methyltransferase [Oscillospiraceae bacterium]